MQLVGLLWGAAGLTTIGKYLIIGVAALLAMGWMVNGITAPYRSEISRLNNDIAGLHEAARKRAELEAKDAARAEADAAEKERLEAQLEAIAHESRLSPGACRLSSVELERLRVLAAGRAN
jgi:hypothetical protein